MNRQNRHYNPATLNDADPIAELFDMIARKGPILMRAGGGGLCREDLNSGRKVKESVRRRIIELYTQNRDFDATARQTGVSKSTVVKITRFFRR